MSRLSDAWDTEAKVWESFAESPDNYYSKRTRLVADIILKNVQDRGKAVDGGCGVGLLSLTLARNGFDIYGYDVSSKMIIYTRRRLVRELDIDPERFRVCHDEEIPFDSIKFKIITGLDLFPYVKNHDLYIKKLSKFLEVGGYIIASCNNRYSLYNYISIIKHIFRLGRISNWRSTLINLLRTAYWSGGCLDYKTSKQAYTAKRFDRFFHRNGFSNIDELNLYAIPYFDQHPLNRSSLGNFLARNLGWQHIGVYQKLCQPQSGRS
jgi:ubiquinone/menaquinone biosynthesis C-methylase UbiE